MQELNKNFTLGRMNKDKDERLVPNGEYRDALNIQVSTSEDSNEGSVQNSAGNQLVENRYFDISSSAVCVGSHVDEENGLIYSFIHKASDFDENGLGVRSDAIISIDPKGGIWKYIFVDVYDVRYSPEAFDGNIISGIPNSFSTSFSGQNWSGAVGIRPEMKVQAIDGVNDLWGVQNDVRVVGLNSLQETVNITQVRGFSLPYTSQNKEDGVYIKFTADRILNFKAGDYYLENNVENSTGFKYTPNKNIITGINIVDDFLLFTDGRNEPKKINIERFENTAASFETHSKLRVKNNLHITDASSYAKEEHITVIRKNPTLPLIVDANLTDSYGPSNSVSIGNISGQNSNYENFALHNSSDVLEGGDYFWIQTLVETSYPEEFELLLTGSSTATSINAYVDTAYADNKYKLRLISKPENYTTAAPSEGWVVSVAPSESLYTDSFVNFTYRYRYTDGEVSCLAPYSTAAFLPGNYAYSPKDGFNLGMENNAVSIDIKRFAPFDMPKDVIGVDIVMKSSSSENLYLIRSIDKDDEEMVQSFSSNGVVDTKNKGFIKLTSEALGRTLESSQALRPFDDVPRRAIAQEFSAGRLMFGNYTKDYDLLSGGQYIKPRTALEHIDTNASFSTNFDSGNNFESSMPAGNTFNTENTPIPCSIEFDPANNYSNTNYVFNVPVDGTYTFSGQLKVVGQPTYDEIITGVPPASYRLELRKCNSDGTVLGDLIGNAGTPGGESYNDFTTIVIQREVVLTTLDYVCLIVVEDTNVAAQQIFKEGSFSCVSSPDQTFSLTTLRGVPSLKSIRSYQVGVVYSDDYGRESTVIVEEKTSLFLAKKYSSKQNKLQATVLNKAPYWASYYKFFIKEVSGKYQNLVLEAAFSNNDEETAWLVFNSADVNKVKIGDFLIQKKSHDSIDPVQSTDAKWKVLDIQGGLAANDEDASIFDVDGGVSNFQIGDNQISISNAVISSASDLIGKFFVKVNYDANFQNYIGTDFTELGVIGNNNGAAFETEVKQSFDLDLFYEASQAFPIKLNTQTAPGYIKIGSKIKFHSAASSNDLEEQAVDAAQDSIGSVGFVKKVTGARSFALNQPFDSTTTDDSVCIIETTGSFTSPITSTTNVIVKFVSQDGSYVCGKISSASGHQLKIIPYTHPTSEYPGVQCPIALDFYNCIAFGNGVESDTIRDDFNAQTIFQYIASGKQSGFKASLPNDNYRELHEKNKIIWSRIYNEDTNTNKINQFVAAENIVKTVNPENGSIQKLFSKDTNLIILCEKKVLRGPIEKDIIFNADGSSQISTSNKVIGSIYPYSSGDHGISTNPESFASDEFRIYFVDKARGSVIRLSRDGITVISDYGMESWFSDRLKNAQSIIGSFDSDKGEYNITIHEITNMRFLKNVYTLTFNEKANGWSSFKSFIKEQGCSLDNSYFTFKNGSLWAHNNAVSNTFYGTSYNSTIRFLFNSDSKVIKEFTALNYEGTQSRVVQFTNELYQGQNYDDGQYYNVEPIEGWYVNSITTDSQEGQIPEFIEKEGKWFNYIKGVETVFDNNFALFNNLDTKESLVQGLGALSQDSTIISGTIVAEGSNLIFNGANTVDWQTEGLSLYGINALDDSTENTFTISPNSGYVISAEDFWNDATSTYYSDVSFTNTGVAGTPSNSVTVTIDFINQSLGNGNQLELDLNIQSPDPTELQYDFVGGFAYVETLSSNQSYSILPNITSYNLEPVYNAFYENYFHITGDAGFGIQEILTVSVNADSGYYFTGEQPSLYVEQDLTVSQTTSTNIEGNITGYEWIISRNMTASMEASALASLIVLTGGETEEITATFSSSTYTTDETQAIGFFVPIQTNGGAPSIASLSATPWITLQSITTNGIYFDISANAGPDRDVTITMYDSYDDALSDPQAATIYQTAANLISIDSLASNPTFAAQTINLPISTNGTEPQASDYSISYADGSGWITYVETTSGSSTGLYTAVFNISENTSGADRAATITITHSDGSTTDTATITQQVGYTPTLSTVDLYSDTSCTPIPLLDGGPVQFKNFGHEEELFFIWVKSSSGLTPNLSLELDEPYNWIDSYEDVPLVVSQNWLAPLQDNQEFSVTNTGLQIATSCGLADQYAVSVNKNFNRRARSATANFFFIGQDGLVNNTSTPDASLKIFQEANQAAWFSSGSFTGSAPSSLVPAASPGEEPLLCINRQVEVNGGLIEIIYLSEYFENNRPYLKWFTLPELEAGQTYAEDYGWNDLWSSSTLINGSTGDGLPSYVTLYQAQFWSPNNGFGGIKLTFDALPPEITTRKIRLGIWHPDTTTTRPQHEIQITQSQY